MRIQLSSTAFDEGQPIPGEYSLEDEDVSPDLQWSGVPSTAKSLVLTCEDLDAPNGPWVHWLLYDLTPSMNALHADLPKSPHLDLGAKQGLNDYKRYGYDGPCPPAGKPHRYFFRLFALDVKPPLQPGLTREDLAKVMDNNVMAQGQLTGTYQKLGNAIGQAV